jgi:uncharacterized protein YjbI with pentapeptide repeats
MVAVLWSTLGLAPLILLWWFQASFLAFHDEVVTALHQIYVVLGLGLFCILIANAPKSWRRWALGCIVGALTLTASLLVATVPDSMLDETARSWRWTRVEVPIGIKPSARGVGPVRHAFWPTAYFFEGSVDFVSGRQTSIFARNLIAPAVSPPKDKGSDVVRISLRERDLRYAVLDGANLAEADLTAANLYGASLKKANLRKTRLECAERGPPLKLELPRLVDGARGREIIIGEYRKENNVNSASFCVPIDINSQMRSEPDAVDKAKSCAILAQADLTGADLSIANLEGVDARSARMSSIIGRGLRASGSNFCDASFYAADIAGADFASATLVHADFDGAKAELASFKYADLTLANLPKSLLGASFVGAHMLLSTIHYSDLTEADVSFSVLTGSTMRNVRWPSTSTGPQNSDHARLVKATSVELVLRGQTDRAQLDKYEARSRAIESDGSESARELAKRLSAIISRLREDLSTSVTVAPGGSDSRNTGNDFDQIAQWAALIQTWNRSDTALPNFVELRNDLLTKSTCRRSDLLRVRLKKFGRWYDVVDGAWSVGRDLEVLKNVRDSAGAEGVYGKLEWGWGFADGGWSNERFSNSDYVWSGDVDLLLRDLRSTGCAAAVEMKKSQNKSWCANEKQLIAHIKQAKRAVPDNAPEADPSCP